MNLASLEAVVRAVAMFVMRVVEMVRFFASRRFVTLFRQTAAFKARSTTTPERRFRRSGPSD